MAGKGRPGRPASGVPRAQNRLALKVREPWLAWLDGLAGHVGDAGPRIGRRTRLVELALAKFAESVGYPPPPPRY